MENDRPIVLLIDEIDTLIGDTLVSVLRQLRADYPKRPHAYPQTVLLCGVRDVRDYRIRIANDEIITGGSAFNIKSKSFRLGNFSHRDVARLYAQHTEKTGQTFEEGMVDYVFEQTNGQPWLVNALAYEACFEMKEGRDRALPITLALMKEARERLIERRDTHLDQLTNHLGESRVHRVISELLGGDIAPTAFRRAKMTSGMWRTWGSFAPIRKRKSPTQSIGRLFHAPLPYLFRLEFPRKSHGTSRRMGA
uniref:Uncharacterized protein n=1 Tax=Candidatus Kentrum sp. TUN TaxID=2126343 RepID=A0A450ZF57_9GAMM|nr:MAG: hypothetical protein BECKTUN1418F_GA0071002_100820 [Candidatus Kentron sp. TUN]VFK52926.1 MAG: hypothetical protein BECKTUN1418E_GA0071001_101120 [Candidatus Kentron sp. TUN]